MNTTPLAVPTLALAALLCASPARAEGEGPVKLVDPPNDGAGSVKFADPPKKTVGPANTLADPLTFVLGVERVLALSPYTQSGPAEDAGVALTSGWLVDSESEDAQRPFYPHALSRIALDVVMGQQISAGASFGVGSGVGTRSNESDLDNDFPTPRMTTFGLGFRLGYVAPLGPDAVFWPRVGVGHAWAKQARMGSYNLGDIVVDKYSHTALSLEAAFVFVPAQHFGFILDFTADIGLAGEVDIVQPTPQAEVVGSRRISDGFGVSCGFLFFL
jgi:hypothetical protein